MLPGIETRRYTAPGGISIAADVGGDPSAPTVILMHGGGQTRHSWRGAMCELLSEGYHVISLDTRGHGDSDWSPEGDYGLESLAGRLACGDRNVVRATGIVGASSGGDRSFRGRQFTRKIASALVLVGHRSPPGPCRLGKDPELHALPSRRIRDMKKQLMQLSPTTFIAHAPKTPLA
jgi:pimeloyl-ACP methyl ester carboxylesterase